MAYEFKLWFLLSEGMELQMEALSMSVLQRCQSIWLPKFFFFPSEGEKSKAELSLQCPANEAWKQVSVLQNAHRLLQTEMASQARDTPSTCQDSWSYANWEQKDCREQCRVETIKRLEVKNHLFQRLYCCVEWCTEESLVYNCALMVYESLVFGKIARNIFSVY